MEQTGAMAETLDIYDDETEDTQKDKYLTFTIGKEDFGIEIRHVTEIVVMQDITEVPDMPEFIKGVINLRGNVISVMDMRRRFNIDRKEYDDRTCIIVVDVNNIQIGLIVDTVKEVVDLPESQIDAPPRSHSGIEGNYIDGMGKIDNQVKILLNVQKILFEEDLEKLQKMAS